MELRYITMSIPNGYWTQVFQVMPNNGGMQFLKAYYHNLLIDAEIDQCSA